MDLLTTSRILPIEGGYNFRDLGFIKTKNNKEIKPQLLIRTDELSQLTTNDLNLLADYNIKTIVDFRTEEERKISVDKVPETCENEFHLDIMAANMNSFLSKLNSNNEDFKSIMHNFYSDLILDENAQKEYTQFFGILQNPENCSVIYHCTAGKDRTGIATALILESLKVDWEIIEHDYLLSNQFLAKKYNHYIQQNPALKDLFLVQAEYLQGAKETIEKNYYSVEDFLVDRLNVDLDAMEKIYTK